MGQNINITDQTRNQATISLTSKKVFLFDNRYSSETVSNPSETDPVTIEPGTLLVRSAAGVVVPATSGNLANVVGISAEKVTVESEGTAPITYGVKGTVAQNALVFPSGVTLATVVGSPLTLKDKLELLGFHLEYVEDLTK